MISSRPQRTNAQKTSDVNTWYDSCKWSDSRVQGANVDFLLFRKIVGLNQVFWAEIISFLKSERQVSFLSAGPFSR